MLSLFENSHNKGENGSLALIQTKIQTPGNAAFKQVMPTIARHSLCMKINF
jgi:hypothetical protein